MNGVLSGPNDTEALMLCWGMEKVLGDKIQKQNEKKMKRAVKIPKILLKAQGEDGIWPKIVKLW